MATKQRTDRGLNAVQGAARKAHFAAGGTVAQWRGSARKFTDRKKRASQLACRRSMSHPRERI